MNIVPGIFYCGVKDMINGVMHIVAAVLFAVISLNGGFNVIWMAIAGVYLVTGIINLAIHALKIRKMEKAAKKAEESKTEKAAAKAAATETTGG